MSAATPTPPTPIPTPDTDNQEFTLLSLGTCLFWTFSINGITHCVIPSVSGFSHWASSSQVHPCMSMPLSFSCWTIFQYVDMPWSVCPSSVAGYVGCFHFLTIVNCAAVNIRVQVLMWMYVSFSWAEISDWNYRAIWWLNVNLSTGFPTWLYHLYESSSFFTSLLILHF